MPATPKPLEDQVLELVDHVEDAFFEMTRDVSGRFEVAMPIMSKSFTKMMDATVDYVTTMRTLQREMVRDVVHVLRAPTPVPAVKKEPPRVAKAA